MAYSNRAQLDMLSHHVDSAIDWAQRTLKLAEPLGRRDIMSHALNNLGTARLIGNDPAGWDDLESSLQIALDHGYQEHVARAYTNLSSTAVSHNVTYERAKPLSGKRYCVLRRARPRFLAALHACIPRPRPIRASSIGTAPAKTWKLCCVIGAPRRCESDSGPHYARSHANPAWRP